MRRFHEDVPRWPALAGVAALLGAALVGVLAPLLAGVAGAIGRADGATPAVALLASALFAAGLVAIVVRIAALTRPVAPAQLGLRAPADPLRALALTAAAALALAALVAVLGLLGDVRGALGVPPELDSRSTFARAYDLPLREPADLGAGLVASALARCVLPVLAAELLLRGFAFPALSGWKGVWPAAVVVATVFGGLGQLGGQPALAVVSIALGGLLCALYLATGSLLPGLALGSGASAAAFAGACAQPQAGVALTVLGCVGATLALAVPVARVPVLRAVAA